MKSALRKPYLDANLNGTSNISFVISMAYSFVLEWIEFGLTHVPKIEQCEYYLFWKAFALRMEQTTHIKLTCAKLLAAGTLYLSVDSSIPAKQIQHMDSNICHIFDISDKDQLFLTTTLMGHLYTHDFWPKHVRTKNIDRKFQQISFSAAF